MNAGELAEQLLQHPDADVEVAVPQQFGVTYAVFFHNDGSLPEHPNGVFALTLDLPLKQTATEERGLDSVLASYLEHKGQMRNFDAS